MQSSVHQFTPVNWGKPRSYLLWAWISFVKQAAEIDERFVLNLAQADALILPWSKPPLFGTPCLLGNTPTPFPRGFQGTSANSDIFSDLMGAKRAFKNK